MKYLFLCSLMSILFSCKHAENNEATTFDIATVKKHIVAMNESYSERFMTNDTAYYINRYCKDAEIYCPGLMVVKGRDSIINFFYQNGTNKEAKIELPVRNVYGNKELVIEEGTYNFPDGKGGNFDKGKFIAIWKEEDGKWKLFREIWNTDNAPVQ